MSDESFPTPPGTPLPWECGWVEITSSDGMPVGTAVAPDDADYIVRAANAFPHLFAALKHARPFIKNTAVLEEIDAVLAHCSN
jgi:hypothetical protein